MKITNKTKALVARSLILWIPWAVVLTLIFLAIYVANQQLLRQSADDPQIQIAEDAAAAINAAEPVSFFNTPTKIDIGKSLMPYLVIYDSNYSNIASTGLLNGASLIVPQGVLKSALTSGEHRLTWQPKPGVRSAIIVIPVKGIFNGFVVVGRSLREIENREDQIGLIIFAVWLFSIVVMFVIFMFTDNLKRMVSDRETSRY